MMNDDFNLQPTASCDQDSITPSCPSDPDNKLSDAMRMVVPPKAS